MYTFLKPANEGRFEDTCRYLTHDIRPKGAFQTLVKVINWAKGFNSFKIFMDKELMTS